MKTIPIVTQNVDRIIRPRDYAPLKDDELLVTSYFRTIQGEGPFAGRNAVFLRLAGCNYGDKSDHCTFCDTSFQFDSGRVISCIDLLVELTHLPGYSPRDILVVTGGEPTLQRNLLNFISMLIDEPEGEVFAAVQVETNGSQAGFFAELASWEEHDDLPERYVRPSLVVSPKASLKANRYAEPAEVVKRLASCFKFVLSADESDPHHTVPEWALEMARSRRQIVYVSPMAVYNKPYAGEVSSAWDHDLINAQATATNYRYAAEYCMEHNLRLSIQQHLFLAVA